MVTDLHLKGNELMIYAIIYGYTQSTSHEFNGSLQYLADWTSTSKRCCLTSLQSLVEKGHLLKSEEMRGGMKLCKYSTNISSKDFSIPLVKKVHGGGEKSSTNNKEYIKDIKEDNTLKSIIQEKESVTRFVPPTVDEVLEYCMQRKNTVDPERFIDFYASKGWMIGKNKMKDWKAAVRTWERSNGHSTQSHTPLKTSRIEIIDGEEVAVFD
jgi:hypothetical protein